MNRYVGGKQARIVSALVVLCTLLGGFLLPFDGSSTVGRASQARTTQSSQADAAALLAQFPDEQARAVPEGGDKDEANEVRGRSADEWHFLTYPSGHVPRAWRNKAKKHNDKQVPEGKDFKDAKKDKNADPPSTNPEDGPLSGPMVLEGGGEAGAELAGPQPQAVATVGDLNWTELGPAPIDMSTQTTGFKYGLTTGRVNALAVHPTNPAIAYAGAAAGGVWKTVNCCSDQTTWTPLWEGKDFVTQAVGSIKLDPTNPDVIYVGTGDAHTDNRAQHSEGIMKSTDGGVTWTQLGADIFTPFGALDSTKDNINITSIEIDPRRPSTVIVGTWSGLYMSYDAGQTWARYDVKASGTFGEQHVSSILIDGQTNPSTMYVALGSPNGNSLNGVYKATIPATGAPTFTLKNQGWIPNASCSSTAPNQTGRIRLAGSRGNAGRTLTIYAQVGDGCNSNALGTWVTRNGGDSWTQLDLSSDINYKDCLGKPTEETQDWYDLFIGVDPVNDRNLFVGRVSFYRATVNNTYNAFASLTNLTNVYGNGNPTASPPVPPCPGYGKVHPDNQAFAWVPEPTTGAITGKKFLVANDGGVFYNSNAGAVDNWITLNNGLSITMFYAGQLGKNFATGPQMVFAGAQDNGHATWDSGNTTKQWQARAFGGDGFFTAFDPLSSTKTSGRWYAEYTNGDMRCSDQGAQGVFSRCSGGWIQVVNENGQLVMQRERSNWSTPFVVDQLHCTTTNCKNMILGTYRLWATATGGIARTPATTQDPDGEIKWGNWDSVDPTLSNKEWVAVSPDLTRGANWSPPHDTITDVRFAPANPKAVVVATADGNVAWSENIYLDTRQVQLPDGSTAGSCTQRVANTSNFACTPNPNAVWTIMRGGDSRLTGNVKVLPNRAFGGVAFDPTTSRVIYAAAGGFNGNEGEFGQEKRFGHVFRGTCAANCDNIANWTWTDRSGNLPDVPADSVIVNPRVPKQVFVGTHFGFYYTNDITAPTVFWQRYQNKLPNTIIKYLTYDRGATTLAAFTFGRGLYTVKMPGAAGFNPCRNFEPNNTAQDARVFEVGSWEAHAFCGAGDQDWIKFTAIAHTRYRIETYNLATSTDTYLTLYGPDGTTKLAENDNGATRAAILDYTPTQSGTYYVKLHNAPGTGGLGFNYNLRISDLTCQAFEPNGTAAQAKTLAINTPQTHKFCAPGDDDYLKFTAGANAVYWFETFDLNPRADTIMELIDRDAETVLLTSDNRPGGTLASHIAWRAPASGVYYLRLRQVGGTIFNSAPGSPEHVYKIRFIPGSCDAFEIDNKVDFSASPPVDQARAIATNGTLQQRNFCTWFDDDWVKFNAAANTTYRVQTSGLAPFADTMLELYRRDEWGLSVMLYSEDDIALGVDRSSAITFRATAAATYYVRVRQFCEMWFGDCKFDSPSLGGPGYGYKLNVVVVPPTSYEPNNTKADVDNNNRVIPINSLQSHTFQANGDRDWGKFNATAGRTYRIETTQLGQICDDWGFCDPVDTHLALFKADGTTLVAENNDRTGWERESLIEFKPTVSGTYYIRACRVQDSTVCGVPGSPDMTYSLRLADITPAPGIVPQAPDSTTGTKPTTGATAWSGAPKQEEAKADQE